MRNNQIVWGFALLALAAGLVCMSRASASAADSFNVLHNFQGKPADGAVPHYGSLILSGTNLYGMTFVGGANNNGTIFEFNTKTGALTLLHSFEGGTTDGANPNGSLILSGTNLYGMTFVGGANNTGTIFEFNTKTGALTLLHSFEGGTTDGAWPLGNLILSGTNLYGMTYHGGANDSGTIFEFNTKTGALTLLHSFEGGTTDGDHPYGNLILSGTTLYGMTSSGGANNNGTIFEFNTKTGQLTLLHSFWGDGAYPYGNLILSGTNLFGMTYRGGVNDEGLIFMINTQNLELTQLHSFEGGTTDGAHPSGSLILSGANLYGMTELGGADSQGTIFEFNTKTGQLTLLHSFEGGTTDGANPLGNLILSGTTLYGMTEVGGTDGVGIIFSLK
jgi:uncharacterized repeat protein (TIGR03803 family)